MSKYARWLVLAVLLGLLALALQPGQAAQAQGELTRYVVVFQGLGVPEDAAAVIEAAGGTLARTLDPIGVAIAVSDDPQFPERLKQASTVYAVGPERAMGLPEGEVSLVYTPTEGAPTATDIYYELFQWDIRRVRADQAWYYTTGSHDTVVAVIDTGVAWNHPDLYPNVIFAACFSIYPECSPYPQYHWHGTHVAGTIAAAFDGGRAVGVGPNLALASYNVFDLTLEGGVVAYDEAIWAAIIDATQRGFDVINMSLGGYVIFPNKDAAAWTAWNRVINYARQHGVTVVASAGNDSFDLNGPVAHVPSDLPGVISVAATGIRPEPAYPQEGAYDVPAFYTNYGASVKLSAPGGDIGPEGTPWPFPGAYYLVFSTYVYLNPGCAATASCPVGYAWAAGTSMASPHVAGVAGLVKDVAPYLTPYQVESVLVRTAEKLGDRQIFGHGMVDALAAVQEVLP